MTLGHGVGPGSPTCVLEKLGLVTGRCGLPLPVGSIRVILACGLGLGRCLLHVPNQAAVQSTPFPEDGFCTKPQPGTLLSCWLASMPPWTFTNTFQWACPICLQFVRTKNCVYLKVFAQHHHFCFRLLSGYCLADCSLVEEGGLSTTDAFSGTLE